MVEILATDILRALQTRDDTIQWYVDRQTGKFHPFSKEEKGLDKDEEFLDNLREDPDRFLAIEEIPRQQRYKFMVNFIDQVKDGRMRVEVAQATSQKMPFKAFNKMMEQNPDLNKQWSRYQATRQIKYMMAWLQYKKIDGMLKMPGG